MKPQVAVNAPTENSHQSNYFMLDYGLADEPNVTKSIPWRQPVAEIQVYDVESRLAKIPGHHLELLKDKPTKSFGQQTWTRSSFQILKV